MDPTVVALLAAGIPAMVAAGSFVAGEVLKVRRARREEIADAVGELVEALVRLLVIEDRPHIVWRWQFTGSIARVSAAAASFLQAGSHVRVLGRRFDPAPR